MSATNGIKYSGLTESTPGEILLGAGTIHRNIKIQEDGTWNFDESLIGATTGGSKISIVSETKDVDVDGATVPVKGLRFKIGEKATLETSFIEMNPRLMAMTTIGEIVEDSPFGNFSEITSKAQIGEGDYIENFAYIGETTDGREIVIVFDHCICTSGFEIETKNKDNVAFKATFECVAEPGADTRKLPWHIVYPKAQG